MRSLSIFALLAVSASLASASTISFACTNSGNNIANYNNGSGSQNFDCAGFSAPGGQQIIGISVTGRVDYQFGNNPGPNTFQVSYALPVGFATNPLVVANTGPESSTSIASGSSSVNSGLPVLSYSAFTVTGTGSTTQGAVEAGSGTLRVTYTYEAIPQSGDVPEPTTLALVGGVLLLAGVRKFRS